MHIVFEALNFITSEDVKKYKLFPVDKLIILMLAKHCGPKGIYPSIETLSKEIQISSRFARDRIGYLESCGVIKIIRNPGKSSKYMLTFLSTPEPQFTSELQFTPEPQFTTPLNPSSGDPGSTDPTIISNDHIKLSNQNKSTRSSVEKRPPIVVEIPDWLDKETWNNFVLFRKKIKSPLTEHAQELSIKKLEKFRQEGQDITEIINTSIMNGWKGLFEIKKFKEKRNGSDILFNSCKESLRGTKYDPFISETFRKKFN